MLDISTVMGDFMNQFKQPLVTIFVIFATAYVLSVLGCAPAGGTNSVPVTPTQATPVETIETAELQPIPVSDLRECTTGEFRNLVKWSQVLETANKAIDTLGGQSQWTKADSKISAVALVAIQKCDEDQYYHQLKPCKKTTVTIISPDKPTVRGYDAYTINRRCEKVNAYLMHFKMRPDPNAVQPEPPTVTPVQPIEPPVRPPVRPPVAPVQPIDHGNPPPVISDPGLDSGNQNSGLRECGNDEFTRLKSWRASLDQANRNIAKQGAPANWRYESVAVDAAATATKSCESLMTYHQTNSCQRRIVDEKTKTSQIKIYNRETLREQCQTARLYHYEFTQHSESLIVPNARLIFDTSALAGHTLAVGMIDGRIGEQCFVSNMSDRDVTYGHGQQALVTAARVYPPQNSDNGGLQMFVFETEHGIKVECYGVEYPGVKTSKSEVVRLLMQKGTQIQMRYELN